MQSFTNFVRGGLIATAVTSFVTSTAFATVTFFDSGGFEPGGVAPYPWLYSTAGSAGLPRHVSPNHPPGPAFVSTAANNQWVAQYQPANSGSTPDFESNGTGTITNQPTEFFNGAQALRVARTANDTGTQRYFYAQQTNDVTNAALRFVTVQWNMRVDAPTSTVPGPGPFFGIEGKGFVTGDLGNSPGSIPHRLGVLGVNAGTREVVVTGRPSSGLLAGVLGQYAIGDASNNNDPFTVIYGQWYTFRTIYDFDNKTFDVGFGLSGGPITSLETGIRWAEAESIAGITRFGDADILGTALLDATSTTFAPQPSSGVAFFDDLIVTAVPEPTTMALISAGAVLALRRRRTA